MRKQYRVKLKQAEREYLRKLITTGKEKARKITRGRILLLAHEGKSDKDIKDALNVSLTTIARIRQRYAKGGVAHAINEKPRHGAPKKFSGKARAKITALACSTPPDGHSRWTLRLLTDRAVELEFVDEISHSEVWRTLKKTNSNRI